MPDILILPASFRSGSLNGRLAGLAAAHLRALGHDVTLATMAEFETPSYHEEGDGEEAVPAGAAALHARLLAADGVIIASPEYNGSMPGYLKNTLDWISRMKPNAFHKKNVLLMSASPSMSGGNLGLWQLRIPLEKVGARVYPAMYSLAVAHKAFTEAGEIADPALARRFETTLADFMEVVPVRATVDG